MILVRTVSGPSEVVAGNQATYKATSFNSPDPPAEELNQINWIIKSGDATVARFNAKGDTLDFDVPTTLTGQTIRIMPFRNAPSPAVSVISRVVREAGTAPATLSNLVILDRADWGPKPSLPRLGNAVNRSRRTKVFIHHTDIKDSDSTRNEWESLDEVKREMRKLQEVRPDLGLDVPYSMVAFCMTNGDLVLCEGRGIDRVGAHTGGHNTAGIGISFQGDFENELPPAALDSHLLALGQWLRELREQKGFTNLGTVRPDGRDVFGHRDVKKTDCPGKHIFERLSLVRFL